MRKRKTATQAEKDTQRKKAGSSLGGELCLLQLVQFIQFLTDTATDYLDSGACIAHVGDLFLFTLASPSLALLTATIIIPFLRIYFFYSVHNSTRHQADVFICFSAFVDDDNLHVYEYLIYFLNFFYSFLFKKRIEYYIFLCLRIKIIYKRKTFVCNLGNHFFNYTNKCNYNTLYL